MNAGSGGAGIEFFPPSMNEQEVRARLDMLVDSVLVKYGPNAERTLYPIRFFEFAQSTDYDLYGNKHLWDMRIECLINPGYIEVTPCVIRLCPAPFNRETFDRDGVVSNLTGREPTLRYMRAPSAIRKSRGYPVLKEIGVTAEILDRVIKSCAAWSEAAWVYKYCMPTGIHAHQGNFERPVATS